MKRLTQLSPSHQVKTLALQIRGILGTVLAVSLAGGMVPALAQMPRSVTQLFPDVNDVVIPGGVVLPVVYNRAEKIIIAPNETLPLTLTIPDDITSRQGRVLIPRGSQVRGQLEPVSADTLGTRFVAQELILTNGTRSPLAAVSQTLTKTEPVNGGIRGASVLKGAAIGAGAAAILAGVTGDRAIATEEILGGAGVGALAGVFLGRHKNQVFIINPNTDLKLRLQSDLRLSSF